MLREICEFPSLELEVRRNCPDNLGLWLAHTRAGGYYGCYEAEEDV